MNGTDDEIAQALLDSLPTSESLSAADMQQLEKARTYMAELFLRSVACNTFMMQSGMTGFPIDPVPTGAQRHELIGKANSLYLVLAYGQRSRHKRRRHQNHPALTPGQHASGAPGLV